MSFPSLHVFPSTDGVVLVTLLFYSLPYRLGYFLHFDDLGCGIERATRAL